MQTDRLKMPIGEAMFTQRSVRKLRTDPIPVEDLHLLIEAAVKAPNGGNNQVGRFLIVNDRAKIREFGALYKEAWWAKRWDDHKWTKPDDIPLTDKTRNLIGKPELRKMKKTARVVNCARGGIINEEALHEALKYGWIGGAALDVFTNCIEVIPQMDIRGGPGTKFVNNYALLFF